MTASFGTAAPSTRVLRSPWWIPKGEIAAFCDSTNQWLPLLCTMNVTVATEMVRRDFKLDHSTFERAASKGSRRIGWFTAASLHLKGRTPTFPTGQGCF